MLAKRDRQIAEQQAKLDRVRVLVAAAEMRFEVDPEFDRQYALEQLIVDVWEVVS
jgi:hypothetical protein